MKIPERTNEVTRTYVNGCVEVAKELGVASVNIWSKMQETQGWQKKFLRLVIFWPFFYFFIFLSIKTRIKNI